MTKQFTSSISVAIPSWNSAKQLKKNLQSVINAAKRVNAEIIIVDDASQDDSVSVIKGEWGYPIKLVINETNLGYGETINRAVSLAQSDLVVILNTDVSLSVNCIEKSIPYFKDSAVFALGLNSGEGYMRVKWERGLFHHFKGITGVEDKSITPFSLWASGGQSVIRRSYWRNLGGMCPLYKPFYWEDTDLGYAAWKRGWKIIWGRDCHCVHDHESSVIAGSFSKSDVMDIAQRNQFLFIWKNISDFSLLLAHLLYLPVYLLHYPKTLISALRLLPEALKYRKLQSQYWTKRDQDILAVWRDSK